MKLDHLMGIPEEDSDPDIEEILVRFDAYIVALVQKMARSSSNITRPEVLDLEIDEITQRVRIKFWKALEAKEIEHHKAYIRTIVSNEFNDLGRKRKVPLPLPTDEDGELYMGNVLLSESDGLADPAVEFEKEEAMDDLMELTAHVVTDLPPRMQRSMINLLKEQFDNGIRLIEAFEKYKVNINATRWPDDQVDTKRLKASISPARRIIARRVGLNLFEHERCSILEMPNTIQVHEASSSIKGKESQSMNQKTTEHQPSKEARMCAEDAKTLAEILDHVEQLHDPYRTAVRLHYVEKSTYSEIAGQLGLPEGTVKSHVSRGIKILQAIVEQQDRGHSLNGKFKQGAEIADYIELLQDPYRTAIELHCLEERTYPQIAKELGLPVGTIKSHVSRGMKILQRLTALS